MKKIVALVIACFLVFGGIFWFASHGYLQVNLANPADGSIYFWVTNQATNKTAQTKTTQAAIKHLQSKTGYQTVVAQNDKSSLVVQQVKGFLQNSSATATLKPQRARSFVGNGSLGCYFYNGKLLASYECGNTNGLSVHQPATASQPSYIQQLPAFNNQTVEGVVRTSAGQTVALLHPTSGVGSKNNHSLVWLSDNYQVTRSLTLDTLNANTNYKLEPFKDGVLAYNSSFGSAFYIDANGNTQPVSLTKPKNDKLQPYLLTSQGNTVVAVYSNNSSGEAADPDTTGVSSKVSTEIHINDNGADKKLSINLHPAAIEICGNSNLCVLANGNLMVYGFDQKKPQYLYMVAAVKSIGNSKNGLVFEKDKAVWSLDAPNRVAYQDIKFGDGYSLCGIQPGPNGYLLCTINSKNTKAVLAIDQSSENTTSIDQKVSQLASLAEVKTISVYGNNIFVSPSVGKPVYDPATKSFGYNQTTLKVVRDKINQKATEIGLKNGQYNLVITL